MASSTTLQEGSTVQDLDTNSKGQIYGTSRYLLPNPAGFVAEAELGRACRCCPCSCCFLPCNCDCVSDEVDKRTYARVYENRVEINYAYTYLATCLLCSCANKQCVGDNIAVYYFDMPPTTAWGAPFPFCCLKCTCFGRPAVATYTPTCCFCIKCKESQTLMAGPCEFKCCICCGDSCFPCSVPVAFPLKNGEEFTSAMKAAYESYATKRGIPRQEQAKFYSATDGCCGLEINDIPDNAWDASATKGLLEMHLEVMDRGGSATPVQPEVEDSEVVVDHGDAPPEQQLEFDDYEASSPVKVMDHGAPIEA